MAPWASFDRSASLSTRVRPKTRTQGSERAAPPRPRAAVPVPPRPAGIPGYADVAKLGQALAVLRDLHEPMACTAAYSGLRWGRVDCTDRPPDRPGARVITVDRKVIEVGGKMYLEVPKNRKQRRTGHSGSTPLSRPAPSPGSSTPRKNSPSPGLPLGSRILQHGGQLIAAAWYRKAWDRLFHTRRRWFYHCAGRQ